MSISPSHLLPSPLPGSLWKSGLDPRLTGRLYSRATYPLLLSVSDTVCLKLCSVLILLPFPSSFLPFIFSPEWFVWLVQADTCFFFFFNTRPATRQKIKIKIKTTYQLIIIVSPTRCRAWKPTLLTIVACPSALLASTVIHIQFKNKHIYPLHLHGQLSIPSSINFDNVRCSCCQTPAHPEHLCCAEHPLAASQVTRHGSSHAYLSSRRQSQQ